MPATYQPLASTTVGTATNQVDFTNITGTYTDIIVVGFLQSTATTDVDTRCRLQVGNGSIDTGNNYSYTYMLGTGSTAISGRESNRAQVDNIVTLPTAGDSEWGTFIWHLMDYSNTTTNKTILHRAGQLNNSFSGNSTGVGAAVALWRSTVAINQIRFSTFGGSPNNFSVGSVFTLYGVKAG